MDGVIIKTLDRVDQKKAGMSESIAQPTSPAVQPHVGLFVTCLVDLYRPSVGFAAIELLESAGCKVEVPTGQTCCGQPGYNSGDTETAQAIARQVIEMFEPYDYVVVPSGSCAGMLRAHYPSLFDTDASWRARANRLAERVHELTAFLVDIMALTPNPPPHPARATYHDACSGLRELGIDTQPRTLLAHVPGLEVAELTEREVCCGFGGTFCVKYPDISGRMVSNKVADIAATQADIVLAGDLGCLLNIAGRLRRERIPIKARHIAEVLAGMTEGPAIGEPH